MKDFAVDQMDSFLGSCKDSRPISKSGRPIYTAKELYEDGTLITKQLAKDLRLTPFQVENWLITNGCYVAGGYLRDLITGGQPKDIDLYFYNSHVPDFWLPKELTSVEISSITKGIVTTYRFKDIIPVQIIYKYSDLIIEQFDFDCNQIQWSPNKVLQFGVNRGVEQYQALVDIKMFDWNPNVLNSKLWSGEPHAQIPSRKRVDYFISKGWKPNPTFWQDLARYFAYNNVPKERIHQWLIEETNYRLTKVAFINEDNKKQEDEGLPF